MHVDRRTIGGFLSLGAIGVTLATGVAFAQSSSRDELLKGLRQGGHVLVMRHASSPRDVPTKETANPDNTEFERQLDAKGREGATAMGQALRSLKVPLGDVLTSPTYRARETVRLAQLSAATPVEELGDGGQSMHGVTKAQAAWLRTRVTQTPKSGNMLLVTHMPNLVQAFPDWGTSVADGETVVLKPDGAGGITVVGRIKIEDWPHLR
jgi:phosphohistidine phosphatase SixA